MPTSSIRPLRAERPSREKLCWDCTLAKLEEYILTIRPGEKYVTQQFLMKLFLFPVVHSYLVSRQVFLSHRGVLLGLWKIEQLL